MKYNTALFDRLPERKQKLILDTATAEFSRLGYQSANTNIIAEKCGISIGSLYKYFTSKENLFLSVCSDAVRQLSESFESVEKSGLGFPEKIKMLLEIILAHSKKNRELINLYNEITTEANRELAKRLSFQMESLSAEYYRKLIDAERRKGTIPEDTDVAMAAFCLDNLFVSLQFSYASEYYSERMKIYVDPEIDKDDERVVSGTLRFILNALKIG